jgi:hypothetical protein
MEREDEFERREEQEAAAEAGEIGGEPGVDPGYDDDPDRPGVSGDPAMEPVYEAGGGEAEGFELAEAELIDRAENPRGPSPMADRERVSEDDRAERTYGEADEEHTAEDDPESSDR